MTTEMNHSDLSVRVEDVIKLLKDVYTREPGRDELMAAVGQSLDILDGPGERNEERNTWLDDAMAMHQINEEALLKVYSRKA